MLGDQLIAAPFQTGDLHAQGGDGLGETAGLGGTGFQRDGGANGLDALGRKILAGVVLAKEGAQRAIVAALQALQIGPVFEQAGDQRCVYVEPLRQLRKILLEAILQAQRQAGLVVDEAAAVLDEHQQQAGNWRHRVPGGGGGPDAAAADPESRRRRRGRFWRRRARRSCGRRRTWRRAPGTAPGARKAEAGSRRILALFDSHGDGPAAEAAVQAGGPERDRLGRIVWNQAHPAARTAPRRHRTAGGRHS